MKMRPQGLRDWLCIADPLKLENCKGLGAFCGVILTIICFGFVVLFFLAFGGAFVVVYHTVASILTDPIPANPMATTIANLDGKSPNLGAGALIAAALSAPLVIFGAILKYLSLRYQKEGHITDRISKAVEQLGATQIIEGVGRIVKFYVGLKKSKDFREKSDAEKEVEANQFSSIVGIVERDFAQDHETGEVYEEGGPYFVVNIWSREVSLIERQGVLLEPETGAHRAHNGEWEIIKEARESIEVRTGAILSLERIAQDSAKYDNCRDHVRVMEIICAYIRHNTSKTSSMKYSYAYDKVSPRADIQTALDVLRRRNTIQRAFEADERYRLDLRNTDLRGADLRNAHLAGALLNNCSLDYTNFRAADLSGADLSYCTLNFIAISKETRLTGANLSHAIVDKSEYETGFNLGGMPDENLMGVGLHGAKLIRGMNHIHGSPITFGDAETVLGGNLEREHRRVVSVQNKASRNEELSDTEATLLRESPFRRWSYLPSSLGRSDLKWQKFKDELGLQAWPYSDS